MFDPVKRWFHNHLKFWQRVDKYGCKLFGEHNANKVYWTGIAIRVTCAILLLALVLATIFTGGLFAPIAMVAIFTVASIINGIGIALSMTGNHMRLSTLEHWTKKEYADGKIPEGKRDKVVHGLRLSSDINGWFGSIVNGIYLLSLFLPILLLPAVILETFPFIARGSSIAATSGIVAISGYRKHVAESKFEQGAPKQKECKGSSYARYFKATEQGSINGADHTNPKLEQMPPTPRMRVSPRSFSEMIKCCMWWRNSEKSDMTTSLLPQSIFVRTAAGAN